MRNKIIFGLLVSLIIVSIIGVVSAETTSFSDAGVEYESEILGEFNKTEWVSVMVDLYSQNITIVNQLLFNLTEDEFKLEKKLLGNEGFSGNITKEGLENLLNNPNVRLISLNRIISIAENESLDQIEKVDEKIKEKSGLGSWIIIGMIVVILIIILYFIFKKR